MRRALKALEVADAAEAVFASGFTEGVDAFDALSTRYRSEPWFRDLHGNFTWVLLDKTRDEILASAARFRWQTPFRYDPLPTIAAVAAPQLWVMGGLDVDAPSASSLQRLRGLIAQGKPIITAFYPQAEHGMTEFEIGPDNSRQSTRYVAGYFHMLADFARYGRLQGSYGDAEIAR